MAHRGWCNSSSRSNGINTINICKSVKSSSYPTGSNHNGSSGSSGSSGASSSYDYNKTYGELAHNPSQHAHNNYKAGANNDIKSVAGFHCHTDRELAFKMALSAISGSSNPAPCEYKACTYDDTNQGLLKAMYNNLVRDIFDSTVAGKASDALIGKQLKDLNEKIIDNDSALQFK
jgi:hypothetical protein